MIYFDGRDTNLSVKPGLSRKLKKNLSVRCLWAAIVSGTVCLLQYIESYLLPSSRYGLPQLSTQARVD